VTIRFAGRTVTLSGLGEGGDGSEWCGIGSGEVAEAAGGLCSPSAIESGVLMGRETGLIFGGFPAMSAHP